jgi:hypothetical protein
MSDPSVILQRYTKQKNKKSQFFIFVYNMIKNVVYISEKFVGLMIKPISKSISDSSKAQAYKDESFIPQNLKKMKKYLIFFHPGVSSPVCKPTTYKYSLP